MIYGMGKHVKGGFSKLYRTAQHREASVVNHMDVVMVTFIGISIYQSCARLGVGEDTLCWDPLNHQVFEVKTDKGPSFPQKSIWKPKVPTRVDFYLSMDCDIKKSLSYWQECNIIDKETKPCAHDNEQKGS